MGVSGSGKTTVGQQLAARLGVPFRDADDLHPASNIRKMASGLALDDQDREPWLDAVASALHDGPIVMACSLLRRRYRDRVRRAAPALRLVYLQAGRALLQARVEHRHHAFMPATLLASQLTTLEPPDEDERPIMVDAGLPVDRIVDYIIAGLSTHLSPPKQG
jgi:gluconokinase